MGFPLLFFPLIVAVFALATGGAQRSLTHCRRRNFMDGGGFCRTIGARGRFSRDREAGIIEQLLQALIR